MPRTARKKSKTGIYHVMLRGIDRQTIFRSNNDKRKFLQILAEYKASCGFELFAYCLMNNHVHLLIKENEESISDVLKKIACKYALWFNKKYDRTGHLFQDRFKSTCVEDESYFLTTLQYILNNPVKSGQCREAEAYVFSSAGEYLLGEPGNTDTAYAIEMFGEAELHSAIKHPKEEVLAGFEGRVSDAEAAEIIESRLGGLSFEQLKQMKRYQLAEIIPDLCKKGISLHQISRITGLGMNRIRNM